MLYYIESIFAYFFTLFAHAKNIVNKKNPQDFTVENSYLTIEIHINTPGDRC